MDIELQNISQQVSELQEKRAAVKSVILKIDEEAALLKLDKDKTVRLRKLAHLNRKRAIAESKKLKQEINQLKHLQIQLNISEKQRRLDAHQEMLRIHAERRLK